MFGIAEEDRKKIVEGLSRLLAETYAIYLKTHKSVWRDASPQSKSLNLMISMCMDQYNEQWLAVELITARIRTLGGPVPESKQEFSVLTTIKSSQGFPRATEMIRELIEAQEIVIETARAVLPSTETAHDQTTCNLLAERITIHEEAVLRLRNLLVEWDQNSQYYHQVFRERKK